MMTVSIAVASFATLVCFLSSVQGHGYLFFPPQRSSIWRYVQDGALRKRPDGIRINSLLTEAQRTAILKDRNFDDNSLFCGGIEGLRRNGGRCGVCGDAFDEERKHEQGGLYAKDIAVVARYSRGQYIAVVSRITANHLGYIEFRLCRLPSSSSRVTQECLNENLLMFSDGTTRYNFPEGDQAGLKDLTVVLPEDVTCPRCVLQWRYFGNITNEVYQNCADISIGNSIEPPPSRPRPKLPTPDNLQITTTTTVPPTNGAIVNMPTGYIPMKNVHVCNPIGIWNTVSGMVTWCLRNCFAVGVRYCPEDFCVCRKISAPVG